MVKSNAPTVEYCTPMVAWYRSVSGVVVSKLDFHTGTLHLIPSHYVSGSSLFFLHIHNNIGHVEMVIEKFTVRRKGTVLVLLTNIPEAIRSSCAKWDGREEYGSCIPLNFFFVTLVWIFIVSIFINEFYQCDKIFGSLGPFAHITYENVWFAWNRKVNWGITHTFEN